jgi:hypothetical protein
LGRKRERRCGRSAGKKSDVGKTPQWRVESGKRGRPLGEGESMGAVGRMWEWRGEW